MQDVDDYTDANGYLHRNAVELKALKVEFETRAMLTNQNLLKRDAERIPSLSCKGLLCFLK